MAEANVQREPYPWLPDTNWTELAPYWEGLRAGEIRLPRCGSCGHFQWYPQAMCPRCHTIGLDWVAVGEECKLYSFTILRRSFTPGFEAMLPLIIGLVEFDSAPGPRVVMNLRPVEHSALRSGLPLAVEFESVADDVVLPYARVVAT